VVSSSDSTLTNCSVSVATSLDATFSYQTTDPATNQPVGQRDTPVDIPPGGSQSFVLGLTANSETPTTQVEFAFHCDNDGPAPVVPGLNTLLFSASTLPAPDIIALAATVGGNGVSEAPKDDGFGFFTIATINLGAAATVDVEAVVADNSDLLSTILLCETDASGACISGPHPSPITVTVPRNATPTFAVFFNSATKVSFDPARNRLFLNFREGAAIRGSTSVAFRGGGESIRFENAGHPTFMSPHARPITVSGGLVYAANTPADTVDVIDTATRAIVRRINVGIDPVGLAVRPDGREIWVANHVSDTVSVIDTDATSPTFHEVIATVQAIDDTTFSTRFDEPVGVAFANTHKAYVALSPGNEIAVVDTDTYTVTDRLPVQAQDPRAIVVRDGRLYVVAFESNNQTQLSGCTPEKIDGDTCTFDAVEHVFTNNNVLSTHYNADIVKNNAIPDRDLFVFDTTNDQLIDTVEGVGTLLYGLDVDSNGRVFISQSDARNDANGKAGTRKHGLAEMENRAFLNQITRIDCDTGCGQHAFFDLEPRPPAHPAPGMALATPFAIRVSEDDSMLIVTAASSNKLFTLDPGTGTVLDRIEVGAIPRGIALQSAPDGAPLSAWVLNVGDNSVTLVDLSAPPELSVTATITLDDPTPSDVKQGRLAFNDANASTTSTFSCESCHPDGHTDQLTWVLDTPICDVAGCTQIPPRLTMPIRGLRDTAPYHWDGIPGDPYGGNNTSSINSAQPPNCDAKNPESCTRVIVDGGLASTMCDQGSCPTNDEGKPGALDAGARHAMSRFLLSVPYPPPPTRPFHNQLTPNAEDGFFEFSFIHNASGKTTGAPTCGDCHKMPFLVSTNTPGTGMDAPTWRGAYDRWMVTPQARLNIIDLMTIVRMDDTFPERDVWMLAGASADIWEMVLQGSTGFSGSFARQVTLNTGTAALSETTRILDTLEASATEKAILLQGEGVQLAGATATPIQLEYRDGTYQTLDDSGIWTTEQLIEAAADGKLIVTLTGRAGPNVDVDNPQPALWPLAPIEEQTRNVDLPFLNDASALSLKARHVQFGASVFVDGRKVPGEVRCESGTLPDCAEEVLIVELGALPVPGGLHFLQLQNAGGLFSNDMMFFSEQSPQDPRPGNLITSGGAFSAGQLDDHWNTVETAADSISVVFGQLYVNVREASAQPWHVQVSHSVAVTGGQEYTLCYDARALESRVMAAYLDTNLDDWRNISGGRFQVNLTTSMQQFSHTFTATETDLRARVAFDFAQSSHDVRIDNIGLYEGSSCAAP
jgi:YVTN family beta-propeller protein